MSLPIATGGHVRPFRTGDLPALRAIMTASLETDAIPGFVPSDIDRALSRIEPDPEGTVVVEEDGRVVGYCTPRHDDLTVHPSSRRRGHGRALVPAALEVTRSRGLEELTIYVPAHLDGSVAFARSLGFRYRSSLWQFELPSTTTVPAPRFGPEVRIRPIARDEELGRYVALMNESFIGHPSPMSWTVDVIRHVHGLPDFEPDGVRILEDAASGRPLGFAKAEVVPGEVDADGRPLGSVALVGVVPAARGRGLGRELLRWTVAWLRDRGAGLIDLSVEADNDRATRLYRSHGFEPTIEWPHWTLATGLGKVD